MTLYPVMVASNPSPHLFHEGEVRRAVRAWRCANGDENSQGLIDGFGDIRGKGESGFP